jgi:hypothetical protein
VNYIIDFSRSVNSPEKRAAWKAAFLKSQKEPAETTLYRIKTEMAQPRVAQSARGENQKRRTDWLRGPIDHDVG